MDLWLDKPPFCTLKTRYKLGGNVKDQKHEPTFCYHIYYVWNKETNWNINYYYKCWNGTDGGQVEIPFTTSTQGREILTQQVT